jgi:hypothetical protein
VAEPLTPVGFYCDHSNEPYATGTHQEWETVAMELAQLRGENARHTEFKIYEVCGHAHDDEDAYVVMVPEIGLVCRSGYQYSICRGCCAPGDEQTEECVDAHDHSECWPCPTRKALGETSGGGS